ncbi:hypothetical protein BP00DRAFT_276910 [Aspergillus indologenus CBS 114.80]|uniref:Uncharacterized protein n=1 Tax=Aspergillus indologenus CBS 114.80 TaxID=1450541 RepID=A0A2V5IVD5_9EURO|nr:hypothetical protein BP00DRAFT_276910 [Aspergillus indologenus CBS 114.80]
MPMTRGSSSRPLLFSQTVRRAVTILFSFRPGERGTWNLFRHHSDGPHGKCEKSRNYQPQKKRKNPNDPMTWPQEHTQPSRAQPTTTRPSLHSAQSFESLTSYNFSELTPRQLNLLKPLKPSFYPAFVIARLFSPGVFPPRIGQARQCGQ